MSWDKQPAIECNEVPSCICCSPRETQLCGESRIAVGFGQAFLSKDGAIVWHEEHGQNWEDCMTVAQAEEIAAADPDHDWRIVLYGPLRGSTYQRHGEGKWMLIEKNWGFA